MSLCGRLFQIQFNVHMSLNKKRDQSIKCNVYASEKCLIGVPFVVHTLYCATILDETRYGIYHRPQRKDFLYKVGNTARLFGHL